MTEPTATDIVRCRECGHEQAVTSATAVFNDGQWRFYFGSRYDHCDKCDGPMAVVRRSIEGCTLSPTPEGNCPVCGDRDLVLARDRTEYGGIEPVEGGFQANYRHIEEGHTPGSVRLFCGACGIDLAVPEELL